MIDISRPTSRKAAILPLMATLATACKTATEPFEETLDIAMCSPTAGPFTAAVTNPYFPLRVGSRWILEGRENGVAVRLEISVREQTLTVAGVATRVLEERETQGGQLVEISRNFFAQAPNGTVCYFGEEVDIYDNGVVTSHEGQWRAGVSNAVPGIFMPASPAVGMAFRQEVAPGVAEDRVVIEGMNESVTTPAGTFTATVRFVETTPLEPGSTSTKVFARDVGLIVDGELRLVSRASGA